MGARLYGKCWLRIQHEAKPLIRYRKGAAKISRPLTLYENCMGCPGDARYLSRCGLIRHVMPGVSDVLCVGGGDGSLRLPPVTMGCRAGSSQVFDKHPESQAIPKVSIRIQKRKYWPLNPGMIPTRASQVCCTGPHHIYT